MKQKMKKISVLTFYKDKEETTSLLQQLGVIHLETDKNAYDDNIKEHQEYLVQINKAMQIVQEANGKENPGKPNDIVSDQTPGEATSRIISLQREIALNSQKTEGLRKERLKTLPWGDFDKSKVQLLEQQGIHFAFYTALSNDFYDFDFKDTVSQLISTDGKKVYFVTLGDQPATLPFNQVPRPERTVSEIDTALDKLERKNEEFLQEISSFGDYLENLEKEKQEVNNRLEYQTTLLSYAGDEKGQIIHLKGWYPKATEHKVTSTLQKHGIVHITEEPKPYDIVPVMFKNDGYTRLFEPITRIFQLPHYYELDLTPLIAVFYPIFFAYCLGDAGYGLIVAGISLAGWFTFFKHTRNIALLGLILGVFTMIMGIVKSGSIFGIPLEGSENVPLFSYLSRFVYIPDDQRFVFNAFNVSLMIGVIQILTGVISSIVNKAMYQSALAAMPQLGKLLIILGVLVLFLANMQNVEVFKPYVPAAKIALFTGLALVLVSHNVTLPLLKRIGSGILPLFFIFTGILGDVLSYVRLFALGVASSVLGSVVNQIGMQIMENGWWGVLLGIVFLLFGHGLNLVLAVLGAFVHPLRLTFVEFYNNAQFEGGGVEYKPFRKLTD